MSSAFLMAGGGTGGHIVPALAVARELRRRGHTPFFVGTREGLEAKLVPAEGFTIEWIRIGGLLGLGLWRRLRTLMQLPVSVAQSWRILSRRGAVAVFSMGGYVAAPPMMAAVLKGVPIVVMEPNAVAGFTSRQLGRFVARALVSFPETQAAFPRGRSEVTGLPVREEFFAIAEVPAGRPLRVLVTGGSRGSRTLNEAVRAAWPLVKERSLEVEITLQAGAAEAARLAAEFGETGLPGRVTAFVEDMPGAYAAADLVVSRAGAGAVSELCAAGKASILVPYPFAADDHQLRNAEAMERAGAARLIRDGEFDGARLVAEIESALRDPEKLTSMGRAARGQARAGAAARAADLLEEFASDSKHS